MQTFDTIVEILNQACNNNLIQNWPNTSFVYDMGVVYPEFGWMGNNNGAF